MQQNISHGLDEKSRTRDILISENYDFSSLKIRDTTVQGLKNAGFHKPSPIQLKAIPLGRCGVDLIVKAKSGTGKTGVFTVMALEMVKTTTDAVQVIIFEPIREIAVQIGDVIKTIGKEMNGLQVGLFIGGLPIEDDIKKIKNCHIAVGTPGRLRHLIQAGHFNIDSVELVILDEANKLMEGNLQNDINFVYNKLPEHKQIIALSSTYSDEVDEFLRKYMKSPVTVTHEVENPVLLGLRQFVTVVQSDLNVTQQLKIKNDELIRLLSNISFNQCLIFFNSQQKVETVNNILNENGWKTTSIYGAQSQTKRLQAVNSLKNFECRICLSTDLTATGIDAVNVDLVINYDIPYDADTYLRRIGRAGRYGSYGISVTIAANGDQLEKLQLIIGNIGAELSIAKLPAGENFVHDIWKCDLNVFERVYGVIRDKKTDLQNSMKKNVLDETEGEAKQDISMKLADIDTESAKKENDLVDPPSLHPWVSVEKSCSVLTNSNIIADASNENIDNPQRNFTQIQHTALFHVTKLLEDRNDSTGLTTEGFYAIRNYLNALQQKHDVSEMENYMELYNCSNILKNITDHFEQYNEVQETNPENTVKLSYDFMLNTELHWKTVLDVNDQSEEEKKTQNEGNIDCDEVKEENIEERAEPSTSYTNHVVHEAGEANVEERYEPATNYYINRKENKYQSTARYYGNYRKREKNNVDKPSTNYNRNQRENKFQPNPGYNGHDYMNTDHQYNPQYSSYFSYYTNKLENDAHTFENVSSFNHYFSQFRSNMESVRDYVQQNIYLEEMAKYRKQE